MSSEPLEIKMPFHMYHTYIIASCTKQAANRSVDQQGEGAYA